jgi:hypothetical protein
MADADQQFDPRTILAALERNYVDYVIIGGLARVLRGSDEITRGVDICPSVAEPNAKRLHQAARELDARPASGLQSALEAVASGSEAPIRLRTSAGDIKLVAVPAGVPLGFVDLRRAATHEPLGHGLRPLVASTADLARMAAALHRQQDVAPLRQLRRIMELEVEREPAIRAPSVRGPSLTHGLGFEYDREQERGLER